MPNGRDRYVDMSEKQLIVLGSKFTQWACFGFDYRNRLIQLGVRKDGRRFA